MGLILTRSTSKQNLLELTKMRSRKIATQFILLTAFTCAFASQIFTQTSTGSGTMCYDARTGRRVSCSRPAPRPVQPAPPRSSNPSPDNSAQIEAERRAAEEKRRHEEAERVQRAEAERQRIERERQEKFEREKQDALGSLKGNTGGSTEIKGGAGGDVQLKGVSGDGLKLKDSRSPSGVARPTAVTAVRGGESGDSPDSDALEKRFLKIVEGMDRLTAKRGWSEKERANLLKYFQDAVTMDIGSAELEKKRANPKVIRDIWWEIQSRDDWSQLIARPIPAKGVNLYRETWKQTGNTCTLYALAAASGRSYWEVLAAARGLLTEAEWRTDAERADPEKTIRDVGLNGMELAYIAETFGRARTVPLSEFAKAIAAGQPLMVHVTPSSGNVAHGHQVILSRTFEKDGQVWFEMIDSNQAKLWQRRYVNQDELNIIIKENGLAFSPDPKPVAKMRAVKRKS